MSLPCHTSTGKTLLVITGATGSGKTGLAIEIARRLGCHIISADSRQAYRDLPIGTAAPTPQQLAAVPHHLVGMLGLEEGYSAAAFDCDVAGLLPQLWLDNDYAIICGGSMMYVDAFVNGLDELPDISPATRDLAWAIFEKKGVEGLHEALRELDPDYLAKADPANHKRLIHAVEVSIQAGVPYSSLLTGKKRKHPFRIVRMAIGHERDELFARINRRVDEMIEAGMEDEARRVYQFKHLNSLNTVGYKELFAMMEGRMDRTTAIARIGKNTRVYAKKQLTWMKRQPEINILRPDCALDSAMKLIGR